MTDAPTLTERATLQDVLTGLGRDEEAARSYNCGCCGKLVPAERLLDVRDRPEGEFSGQFSCDLCTADLRRQERYEWEVALALWQAENCQLSEETLADLRAKRDTALRLSDWTQLADNRDRLGPEASAGWDAYRAALRSWLATARDTGVVEALPTPPE